MEAREEVEQVEQAIDQALEAPEKVYRDGRRNLDGSRVYEVQEIQARHFEIARLKITGMSNLAIADRLGITSQTVSDTINSPIVRTHIQKMQGHRDNEFIAVQQDLMELSVKALEGMKDVIEDKVECNIALKMRVADSVLDRAGHGRHNVTSITTNQNVLNPADIEDIKTRAEQLGLANGKVVEIQAEVLPVATEA